MWYPPPRVLLTYPFLFHVPPLMPSSLIILIMTREADDSYTRISCQTVPVNSQLISCQRCSCGWPQAPKVQDVLPDSLISINGPASHFITNTERNLRATLGYYLLLNASPLHPIPFFDVTHQNGPASLHKCFLIISLLSHCLHSCPFSTGLLWRLSR